MVRITDLFKPEELTETNNGYKTICPDCGLQGGRTEGFVIFTESNTAYCHSSHKTFNVLETAALKFEMIKCIEGRDDKDDDSPVDTEMRKEILNIVKDEYGTEFLIAFKNYIGESDSSYVKLIDTEEEETEIEVTISKSKLNFDLFTKNALNTDHLDLYDEMEMDLSLDGENYKPFKKGLWYYEHSLKQPTVAYKINLKTKTDNRPHFIGISNPSGGKTTTKNQIKRISNKEDNLKW